LKYIEEKRGETKDDEIDWSREEELSEDDDEGYDF
jgi:hypothetical protein